MLQQFRQPEKRGFYSNGSRQTEDTWKGACFGLDRETAAALTGSQKFAACEQVLCGMGFEAGEQEILLQVPDAGFYRMAQIRWTTGRPPQSVDEVAAGAETLEALGQGAACIGDRITLPGGRVLTLCGIAELPDRTGSLPLYLTREGMKALRRKKRNTLYISASGGAGRRGTDAALCCVKDAEQPGGAGRPYDAFGNISEGAEHGSFGSRRLFCGCSACSAHAAFSDGLQRFSADVPDRPVRKSEVSEKNVRFCARPGSRVRCGNSCCAGARLSVARAADCAVLRCDSSSDRILRRFLPPEISVVLSTHPMTGGTMPGNSNPSLFSMESHTL